MQFIQIPIPQEMVFSEDTRSMKLMCRRLAEVVMNLERTVADHARLITLADEKFKEIDTQINETKTKVQEVETRVEPLEKKELLREERKLRGEEIDALKTKMIELEKKLTE